MMLHLQISQETLNRRGEMANNKSLGLNRIIGVVVIGFITLTGYATPPVEVWNKVFDSGEDDWARGVAVVTIARSSIRI